MSRISTAGKHHVNILSTRWEEMEGKNGAPNYPCLIIEGVNAANETAEGRIFFSNALCTGGKFQGKPRYEESIAKCIELGMSAPFNPTKTGPLPYVAGHDELFGTSCEFVTEETAKYGMSVKYINTTKKEPLSADRVKEMWAGMSGIQTTAAAPVAQKKPVAKSDDIDEEIPF